VAAAKGEQTKQRFAAFKAEFQEQVDDAGQKLETFKTEGGEAYDTVKEGVNAAVAEIKQSVEKAKAEFGGGAETPADQPVDDAASEPAPTEPAEPQATEDQPAL
jgi:hypothetical protein